MHDVHVSYDTDTCAVLLADETSWLCYTFDAISSSLVMHRSFVKRAMSWTSTMSLSRHSSALLTMRSVKLHGQLHTASDIQVICSP